ncbi:MAG: ankyrin repeat domain-containing protein, partial [Lentisphaeria bacterium]|nr:ankyrin repeat domain-containing protein [Lentisphaeria bacterium]
MPEEWINVGLLRASKNGNAKNVNSALSRGARPDVTDEAGSTPLMLAAGLGHLQVVQLLIKVGADVNAA